MAAIGAPGNVMNAERAAKVAAGKLGIPLEEYQRRRAQGEKWCSYGKHWSAVDEFGVARDKVDGRNTICRACVRLKATKYNLSLRATKPRLHHTGGRAANSQYEDIWRLQREGMSLPEIARTLGCSYQSVRRTIHRAHKPKEYREKANRKLAAAFGDRPVFISLDTPSEYGTPIGELIPVTEEDPVVREAAERLRAIVGEMEPEDVRFLDDESLARLQDRLREEGLAPRGVTSKAREAVLPKRKTKRRAPREDFSEFLTLDYIRPESRGHAKLVKIAKQKEKRAKKAARRERAKSGI